MAVLAQHDDGKLAEVWSRLDLVTDPELDEPVTDLGFIERVAVSDDGVVDIEFRLPTYWCSANFAFLMADDIHRSVSALAWTREVRPHLHDHMVAEEINRGVRLGLSFGQVFREFDTGDTLDELREKFRRKAFERRQEAVILVMRAAGCDVAALCRMTLATFDQVDLGLGEAPRQKRRYREILIEKGLAAASGDRAFITYNGRAIEGHELRPYLQRLRAVRINMEFNSALCRGLLDARYSGVRQEAADAGGCGKGCGSACSKRQALALSN